MAQVATFGAVTPVIPAIDLEESLAFYTARLGFTLIFRVDGAEPYAGLKRDDAVVHLSPCTDRRIAEGTAFRIEVTGLDVLYDECRQLAIVDRNGRLAQMPWGTREFAVRDPSGVCITFWEREG